MQIRFLGHAAFELTDGDTTVLVDPFLTGNPQAAVAAEDLNADAILLTHGHEDHFGDTVSIAKRTDAHLVAILEIARELSASGLSNVHDPNIGGTVHFDWGWVRLVPACHTSTTPKGTASAAAGLLINFGGATIYHLGDTGLFSDLALVGRRDRIDVALVCIGGHYTMDRFDALEACKLIGAKQIVPCHYNTFPTVQTDVQAFKADVEAAGAGQVIVLDPGDTHTP
jgi:L-ascorbate metabolism protein UlaG (beta-lactamase superfamily)